VGHLLTQQTPICRRTKYHVDMTRHLGVPALEFTDSTISTVSSTFTMAENAQLPINAPPPTNADTDMNDGLDASLDTDVQPQATQPDAMNLDGANDTHTAPQGNNLAAAPLEARTSAKKDATLRDFLSKMDDHAPIVCFVTVYEACPSLTWP
jgi:hypothetical protein